jgi:glycerophosphoryl diester phosphodiesterase
LKNRLLLIPLLLTSLFAGAISAQAACWDPRSVIKAAKDPNSTTIVTVMHRGLWLYRGNELPENSMGAFIAADRACIAGIETDVRMTSDGVPVLLHDQTIGRTTTSNLFDKKGPLGYDPEKRGPNGANPKINDIKWRNATGPSVDGLRLLRRPYATGDTSDEFAKKTTNYPIETVESFYNNYIDNRLSTVVFFDIKDAAALPLILKQLYSDQRDYNHGRDRPLPGTKVPRKLYATELTVLKFNIVRFPTPAEYQAALNEARKSANAPDDMPDPLAYPYYGSNSMKWLEDHGLDPFTGSVDKWADPKNDATLKDVKGDIRIGIELNVKQWGGILDHAYQVAKGSKKVSIGNLHAAPDYMRINPDAMLNDVLPSIKDVPYPLYAQDAFYAGEEGACCYQLKDRLDHEWQHTVDKQDNRSDPKFIAGHGDHPDFTIITTDDYDKIRFEVLGSRGSLDKGFEVSPLAKSIMISYRPAKDPLKVDYEKQVHWFRAGHGWKTVSAKMPFVGTISDQTMTSFNDTLYTYWADKPDRLTGFSQDNLRLWRKLPDIKSYRSATAFTFPKPGLITYRHKMYIFRNDGNQIYYNISDDGKTWSADRVIPDVQPNRAAAPVPVEFDGKLYLFYRGPEGSIVNPNAYKSLYYVTLDPSLDPDEGRHHFWTKPVLLKGLELAEDVAPVVLRGRLYFLNRGANADNKLHCRIFIGNDQTSNHSSIDSIELLGTPSVATRLGILLVHFKMALGGLLAYSEVQLKSCENAEFRGKQSPNDYPAKGITGSPTTW